MRRAVPAAEEIITARLWRGPVHLPGLTAGHAAGCPNMFRASRENDKTIQQSTPISIIETPMVFRMSTRNRSLFGAHPQAMTYSCKRNRKPKPKISAPRQIVLAAIWPGARFF